MKKSLIKRLLREGLINEITIGDAWTKYYSNKEKFPLLNGNSELFNTLNGLYPKNGDYFNKGYFTWIYNLLKSNNLKEEDFYKVKEYLSFFNKFINKIPKEDRDINKYKNLTDLYLVVKPFMDGGEEQPTSKTDELKKIKKEEIEKVFENENWLVMIPKTERASCIIGKGTQWCTAAKESNNYFEYYSKDGPLYVIVDKDPSARNKKYQLHFESDSLMDENDRPVPAAYFFTYVENADELLDFFQGRSEKFWDFILATSADDMADGGYNELFMEALGNDNVSEDVLKKTLDTLRRGYDSDSIRNGFVYEKDPDNIDKYEVQDMLTNEDINDEDKNDILNHLFGIGYDFDYKNPEIRPYIKAKEDLNDHNLEINKEYKIDKGKTIKVNYVNFDEPERPYNVTSNGKNGNINLETLINLIHQGQLFDEGLKNKK